MGSSAPYGYWLDQNDRHKLIIDEDAAVVVNRIFKMRAEDFSYNQIADTLNREGIPNPRDYYYHKIGKPNPRVMRHYWSEITITHILKNEVYIGNMVQFKTGVVSYKNHSIRAKPEETWIRCENTHEPIIGRKLWDAVQSKFRKKQTKQRRTQSGELPLFSGLLKCADCGGLMHFKPDMNKPDMNRRKDGTNLQHHAYTCGTYKHGGSGVCTSHWIMENALVELVRNDLEQYVKGLEVNEEQLQNLLMEQYSKDTKSDRTATEKELHSAKTRIAELEMLQNKLYEELLLGQLPRETLIEMSQKYKTEKTALEQKSQELQSELDRLTAKAEDIHNWLCVVREYMSGTVLDRELLHRLIKVIRVGETIVVDGQKQREVEIVYRF